MMKKPLKQIKLCKTVMIECKRQWNYVGKKIFREKERKRKESKKQEKKKMRKEKEKER